MWRPMCSCWPGWGCAATARPLPRTTRCPWRSTSGFHVRHVGFAGQVFRQPFPLGVQGVFTVRETQCDLAELLGQLHESVDQVGVEMAAPAILDDLYGFLVAEGALVHALGNQRVVHIGHG